MLTSLYRVGWKQAKIISTWTVIGHQKGLLTFSIHVCRQRRKHASMYRVAGKFGGQNFKTSEFHVTEELRRWPTCSPSWKLYWSYRNWSADLRLLTSIICANAEYKRENIKAKRREFWSSEPYGIWLGERCTKIAARREVVCNITKHYMCVH